MRDCKDCIFRRDDYNADKKHYCRIKDKTYNDSKLHAVACRRYYRKEKKNV